MALINFLKPKNQLEEGGRTAAPVQRDDGEPEKNCPNCHKDIALSRLWANGLVCPCGYHFRMTARQRIAVLTDKDSFHELYSGLKGGNPLNFPGYKDKVETVRAASGEVEAVVCGTAKIGRQSCCLFVMEPYFMMGSMGSAVGEKITLLFEYAAEHRMPVVGFTVSGGARMQEGALALYQMAKTVSAVRAHAERGLFYLSVVCDPTLGGVSASFASMGDVILALEGARFGFTGRRIVEETTHEALPDSFQTAVYAKEHGQFDRVVREEALRAEIARLLGLHAVRHPRSAPRDSL